MDSSWARKQLDWPPQRCTAHGQEPRHSTYPGRGQRGAQNCDRPVVKDVTHEPGPSAPRKPQNKHRKPHTPQHTPQHSTGKPTRAPRKPQEAPETHSNQRNANTPHPDIQPPHNLQLPSSFDRSPGPQNGAPYDIRIDAGRKPHKNEHMTRGRHINK